MKQLTIESRGPLLAILWALSGVGCNLVFGLEPLYIADPTRDAGSPDAGSPDVGAVDVGSPDARSPDAGPPDVGAVDAGQTDRMVLDGGICGPGALRCSASGVPQKCNGQGTAFEDQDACPTATPDCDTLTGLCRARCTVGSKRCGSSVIQQCDLQGVWQDTTSCPFACTGTGSAVGCGGSCKPGTRTCGANNTPLLCDDMGANQMQTACTGACTGAGQCTGDCAPNATRCAAGSTTSAETCDAMGHWGPAVACTFVCDAATNKCGGECTPGTADRCSGSTIQSCDATGHWKDKLACGSTPCSMGQCRACTPNQKQCNAGKPQTCNASGAWSDDQATACQFLCDAATGKCAGECVPGTDTCSAKVSKHCGANGLYDAGTTCPNICDTATGKCGGVCVPNAHRCSGSTAQTCGANGQWGSDTACPFGCATATGLCNTCTNEPMATTCASKKCGPTMNNCGVTVQCPTTCTATGETCGGGGLTGVCGCTPEASTQTCQNGAKCGNVINNCGIGVACSGCTAPQTCGGGVTPGVCGCTGESNTAFCSRLGKTCGPFTGADNCGVMRTVPSCGTCNAPQTCGGGGTPGMCACPVETNAAFCSRLGKNCDVLSANDNCGTPRSANCGTCTGQQVCTANHTCVTPNCSGPSSCGTSDGAGGVCTGARGTCPSKPNTTSVCQNTCQYTCDRNTLSCSTSSTPACAVWTFESGTPEGWALRADSVVPTGASPAVVTNFAFDGSHSLAISYSSSDPFVTIKFGVKLCPTGSTLPLSGKTFHTEVRFERSSGTANGDGYLELYNGSTHLAAWADATITPGAEWVQMDGAIAPTLFGTAGDDAVTDIAVVVSVGGPSSGTIYIDNITLQ